MNIRPVSYMLKFFGMTGKFKKEGGLKTLRRLLVLGSKDIELLSEIPKVGKKA